ncbi:MAG: hypothetical protein QXT31_03860, partial [Candidatus Bathyarchaeia archaeon]
LKTGILNPISETPPPSYLIYLLQKLFPFYKATPFGTISYMEFILKLLIFLTPYIVTTSIICTPWALLRRRKLNIRTGVIIFLTLWILIPLIACLVLTRDVRYFLPSALPTFILSAWWIRAVKPNLSRAYKVSVIGSMLTFLLLSYNIANQSYAGISEIKQAVETHNIPHEKILTNYWLVRYMFPESDVLVLTNFIENNFNSLNFRDYNSVIIWHHNRGSVPQPSLEIVNALKSNYSKCVRMGSNFSYIEIFY